MTNTRPRRARTPQSGFTLIELLVVVLIVGILAAIAVPQYFSVIERGHFAEALGCVNSIKGAQERFRLFAANSQYTGTPASLDTGGCPGLRYFTLTLPGPTAVSYNVTLTRNAVAFNLTSGAASGYTVVMVHTDASGDTWTTSTAPSAWLP